MTTPAYDDLAAIAADALATYRRDTWTSPSPDAVDLTGVTAFIARTDDGCPDCAADFDGICAGCRAEGIALGAGGR